MDKLDQQIEIKTKEIAEKIKALRIEKGFTNHETFAYEYEFNRAYYWRVEKGQNITLKTLLKILAIHELSLEEFFKGL